MPEHLRDADLQREQRRLSNLGSRVVILIRCARNIAR